MKGADTPINQSASSRSKWISLYKISPRRLRAKYTHRTNLRFVLCVFRLAGSHYAGYGNQFVNGHRSVHSQRQALCCREGGSVYRKKFIYSDVDAAFPMARFNEMTRARYYEIMEKTGIPMKPGAKELLRTAKAAGLRIALATSSSRDHAEAMLVRYDLAQFFDGCVCGDMVTRSKPDPEIYEKACQLIDVPAAYAVALEDAPSGVRSAAAAGMRVIVVPDLMEPSEEILALAWKRCDSLVDVIGMI